MLEEKESKLGVALSGGGFRAGFFHIGVLTRMADMGLLRHVDVISTVSGGSIVGAFYYLHLKKLIECKQGSEITDEEYQEMMATIQTEFLQAVQCNIRLKTFVNPWKNLRMCLPNYSRSDYIGELFEKFLFNGICSQKEKKKSIHMQDLTIDTTVKNAKVPILLMNATVLNNGHNWVFTHAGMGETDRDKSLMLIDGNFKLEKVKSYDDLCAKDDSDNCNNNKQQKQGPCKHRYFRLGHAVAASASVPGVFVPLAVSNLYDQDIRVQLADGGVHDNQGISTLVKHKPECTHFIISDASIQMENEKEPSTYTPGVVRRSVSILADLVREKQLSVHMRKYHRTTALLHLKKRLPIESIPVKHQEYRKNCTFKGPFETYGVNEEVQTLLSRVRTDLDSFSDAEAYSLMLDGYKMSEYEFSRQEIKNLAAKHPIKPKKYCFFEMQSWLSSPKVDPYYKKLLMASSKTLFKPFRISLSLKIIGIMIIAALTSLSLCRLPFLNFAIPSWMLLPAVVYFLFLKAIYMGRVKNPTVKVLVKIVPAVFIALTGWIFIRIYLATADKLFLYLGSMERLNRKAEKKKQV
ncbi:patatin-like phospholipase family protein [Bacillus sp. NSP9.1]|uniref:patatin-like phospholipase family protein n=1 Tax=Bacillus sp. NSP9.1 TaxID=1071078 RepID=UPI0004115FBB|nr:patatin-like phospholipase family protein [Bacillus sp. NSP9.1]QHZ46497.1 patatin-like phospholipase family protein [Bacillus sp. NSP9.1]